MEEDREDQSEDSFVKKADHVMMKRSSLFGGGDQHGGKLCIKLKLPKEEDESETMIGNTSSWEEEPEELAAEQQQNRNDEENGTVTNVRICQVCGKGFKSGKALGGHMRVHFQPNKDLIFTPKKLNHPIINKLKKLQKREKRLDFSETKKQNYYYSYKPSQSEEDGLDDHDEDYPCSVCGKNFRSMKSLSGHMRCHPDREWRGIQPPSFNSPLPVHNNKVGCSPSSSVSDPDQPEYSSYDYHNEEKGDDETDDLSKSLGNCWSVTAKRGRKAIMDVKAKEDDDDQGAKERNAIFQLMSLAKGDNGFFEANNQKVVEEEFDAITNCNFERINIRDVDRVDESKKKKRRRKRYEDHPHHPVKELQIKEKSDLGNSMIEDHEGHVKNGVRGNDFLAGGKKLEIDMNWPKGCAAVQKDSWDDDDDDDNDSEKTHDNQLVMDLKRSEDKMNSNGNLINSKKKRKKKKMKLRDLELVHHQHDLPTPRSNKTAANSSSPELEKFRCTTCDKCFPSHQALGGHRSSHNKSRMLIENALDHDDSTTAADDPEEDDQECEENLAMEGEGAGSNSSSSKGQMVAEEEKGGSYDQDHHHHHLCKICNTNFSSGQALGGHQRCHSWINNATRSQVTASPGSEEQAAMSHSGHKVVGFDLNEKPPMEEDDTHDGVAGTGCGYASSNSVEYLFF